MKTKRIMIVFLAIVMMFLTCGCSPQENTFDSQESTEVVTTKTDDDPLTLCVSFDNTVTVLIDTFVCNYYVDEKLIESLPFEGPYGVGDCLAVDINRSDLHGSETIEVEYVINGKLECSSSYYVSSDNRLDVVISYYPNEESFGSVLAG